MAEEKSNNEDGFTKTLRDYLQPIRSSTPSCMVLPSNTGTFEIKHEVIQLLSKFHGLDSESPYLHLKEFDEVCATLHYANVNEDAVKIRLFPFSLKEKAKAWLHSLRPRSIGTWQEMSREFLKKFFPTHKTNTLRRNIMNFSQKENETFFRCWERFKELLLTCPHHGYETWRVISFFYDGLSSEMRQFVEMMCNGEFMDKDPEEAWDYFDFLAENSQSWNSTNNPEEMKPIDSSKGMIYSLKEDTDMNTRVEALARKIEAMECQIVKANKIKEIVCEICESNAHYTKDCPTVPAFQEVLHDQANFMNNYKKPCSSSYYETSNLNWNNHPNSQRRTQDYDMQNFLQTQNAFNYKTTQAIEDLKAMMSQIISTMQVREKGTFPAQSQPNPKGQFEIGSSSSKDPQVNVQEITTLRSGREINKEISKKVEKPKEPSPSKGDEKEKQDEPKAYVPVAPFPQRLLASKKDVQNQEVLDVFK